MPEFAVARGPAPGRPAVEGSATLRAVLVSCGLVNVGLGILGILLPGMPATVFLLVAGWCFARSSPRLSRWLDEHPRLGPYLRMARTRSMPRRARILSICAIWAGIGSSLALRSDAALWWQVGLLGAGCLGSICVASMRGKVGEVRMQPAGTIVR